ncbi:proteoglycan 4-like [Penaeus chinensis]|uniref:proteoglycan 4-like n=1 Tax=Penaeus chinensis TaxID=139456 RepID=UPI001FB71E4C|nr:proteoglycan 4-like [Penaeus chinensis]
MDTRHKTLGMSINRGTLHGHRQGHRASAGASDRSTGQGHQPGALNRVTGAGAPGGASSGGGSLLLYVEVLSRCVASEVPRPVGFLGMRGTEPKKGKCDLGARHESVGVPETPPSYPDIPESRHPRIPTSRIPTSRIPTSPNPDIPESRLPRIPTSPIPTSPNPDFPESRHPQSRHPRIPTSPNPEIPNPEIPNPDIPNPDIPNPDIPNPDIPAP